MPVSRRVSSIPKIPQQEEQVSFWRKDITQLLAQLVGRGAEPTGPAGGGLGGFYPNPTVRNIAGKRRNWMM